ncbi:MAG: MoaD/ThiS family protein [Bacteroidota bacterium]
MAKVSFTEALKQFFPGLATIDSKAGTIWELLGELELTHPGIKGYLVDERGAMRKHVNIYIGDELIKDRVRLSDTISVHDQVLIFQALSGG